MSRPRRRPRPGYRVLSHTADVGLRAEGATLGDVLANAGLGLSHLLSDRRSIRERAVLPVSVEANDAEGLVVAWLSELLYRFEVDRFLVRRITVQEAVPWRIVATCHGEAYNPSRHQLGFALKGVTYHQLSLRKEDGWRLQTIFDV